LRARSQAEEMKEFGLNEERKESHSFVVDITLLNICKGKGERNRLQRRLCENRDY
jgi:hypothetical protein